MSKKVAVVTGSLRGLGLETALALAKKDCDVIITGRNDNKGKQIQEELSARHINTTFMNLDVSDINSIKKFCDSVINKFKRVDILVNNAGVMIDNNTPPETLSDYAKIINSTFQTNTLGPFLLCQALIPEMVKNKFGRIVNVSSGMGQLSEMSNGHPGYRISKTALNAVTKMFAEQTKGTNVLVNSVCPGWVRTDMGGPNAIRSVAEGADTIIWLATLEDNAPSGGFFRDRKLIEW